MSEIDARAGAGRKAAASLKAVDDLLTDVLAGRRLPRHALRLWLLMSAAAALYGAVCGMWNGPRLAAYVALKLPLVLGVTWGLTLLLSWFGASLLGLPLRFAQVAVLILLGLAAGSLLLASLAPVAALFTLCAPHPDETARTAHNLLYLMHTAFVGGCGFAGTRILWRGMQRLPSSRATLGAVYGFWVLAYSLVGGEVAWLLRPFIGSIYYPVVFLRPDAFNGNVYEFIFTDIVPYLLRHLG
jgi:hypothetical protein